MDTKTDREARNGAMKLISTCLGLLPGQEMLIVTDEFTVQTASLVNEVAVAQQIRPTIIFVPSEEQKR